jgi:hypothetical protein
MRGYVQDLHVVEVTDEQKAKAGPSVQLCPFILSHLQPVERIIPFMPLYIPSCPGYIFHLLYVEKETIANHVFCVAIFLLLNMDEPASYPSYVGARTSESFLDTVNSNIQRERARLRALTTEARFSFMS